MVQEPLERLSQRHFLDCFRRSRGFLFLLQDVVDSYHNHTIMSTSNGLITLASPFTIPKAASAAVLSGPYGEPYAIHSPPVPRPGSAEALVRLLYSGVCHGDIYSRSGGGPAPTVPKRPLTGGHEGVGIIVALGHASIEGHAGTSFRIGDTVGIAWRSSVCGTCEPCTLGAENHCTRQCVTGMHRDGTYQCTYCQFPTTVVRVM